MNLTKEQLNELKIIRDNNEKIIVSGINAIGEKFLTSCHIDKNRQMLNCFVPAIFHDNNFRANLATDHQSRNAYSNALIIDEISNDQGHVIYRNLDIERYKQYAADIKLSLDEKIIPLGLNIVEDDEVTSKLRKKIGKPVIIDKNAGVLTIITNCNYDGTVSVLLSNGNTSKIAYVTKNSKLYSVKLNGEVLLEAENQYAPSTKEIFNARAENVKQALLSNFENDYENQSTLTKLILEKQ